MKAFIFLLLAANLAYGAGAPPPEPSALTQALDAIRRERPEGALAVYKDLAPSEQRTVLKALLQLKPMDFGSSELKDLVKIVDKGRKTNPQLLEQLEVSSAWKRLLVPAPTESARITQPAATTAAGMATTAALPVPTKPSIVLINKQGKRATIDREVAANPAVSRRLAQIIKAKPNITEISLDIDNLLSMVTLLNAISQYTKQYSDLPPAPRLHAVIQAISPLIQQLFFTFGELGTKKQPNNEIERLIALYLQQAHYLGSEFLFDGLLWQYADFVHKHDAEERIENVIKDPRLLARFSTIYFLRTGDDIDEDLGVPHQSIRFDVLQAFDLFPPSLLKAYPNFATNPDEERNGFTALEWSAQHNVVELSGHQFTGAILKLPKLPSKIKPMFPADKILNDRYVMRQLIRAGLPLDKIIPNDYEERTLIGALIQEEAYENALEILLSLDTSWLTKPVQENNPDFPLIWGIKKGALDAAHLLFEAGAPIQGAVAAIDARIAAPHVEDWERKELAELRAKILARPTARPASTAARQSSPTPPAATTAAAASK